MANSSYDIQKVYSVFNKIGGYFRVENGGYGGTVEHSHKEIEKYCGYNNYSLYGNCLSYLEKASSGVINLLENLMKYGLDYDKLAEYAILFLTYKLKQNSDYKSTKLNDFYTNRIEKNKYYNMKINGDGSPTYKEIMYRKKDLMNIIGIPKFNDLFKLNNDSNINGNTSYREILYTLSNDYDNFKSYCAENCKDCNDLPTLPKIKTPSSTLIPVLSTFPVIPAFLGIAYKYSLFGIDKLFQRQYLRKKLKKINDYSRNRNND
ncbi:hypothetical protein YYE_04404 [Plasmodium vinckei vinckei]|uniref:CIR protein PIR protein n=1 Tax=Plasmodium vinckei vinckei TaxID=54757 RepID=A0A081IA67_PLAVN|nr:hypothetical protein YYE_04404 [Plasmodium vinckei vinckei]